jgi:hypothetical protein
MGGADSTRACASILLAVPISKPENSGETRAGANLPVGTRRVGTVQELLICLPPGQPLTVLNPVAAHFLHRESSRFYHGCVPEPKAAGPDLAAGRP